MNPPDDEANPEVTTAWSHSPTPSPNLTSPTPNPTTSSSNSTTSSSLTSSISHPIASEPSEITSIDIEDSDPLPTGNPLRLVRGGVTAAVGAIATLGIMALDRQLRWGVPLGLVGILIAAFGVLDLLGTFDDPQERVAHCVSMRELGKPLLAAAGATLMFALFVGGAVHGRLPIAVSAIAIPIAFLLTVAALYRIGVTLGPWAHDETGHARPLQKRHGFWVIATSTLLYLPMLGNHSLTGDPWEAHYGEVSREILSRNDWISTWWAQDGWFWSKPILDFWLQALSMATWGVNYHPDQMLVGAAYGHAQRPEWAVRLPIFLIATLGAYLLYKGVAKVFGRRAGLLGALVLLTMPQWAFLTHQTMTDMPFVAPMASAMGLVLLGIHTDPTTEASLYEVSVFGKRIRFSLYHLVFGFILLCVIPQILYLVSRNVELVTSATETQHGFRWHLDTFWSGSKGNCGLPGNEICALHRPANSSPQPALQGLLWTATLGVLLYFNWGERRLQRLLFVGAFLFAAISTMAKGPAGLLLPVVCALVYVGVTGRWRELTRMELLSGAVLVAVMTLPWYVAMYTRHGSPFIDRLIFHDMWKRALTHVHDTNEGDDTSFRYYIWQLGYACFPWSGLVPLALVWWTRKPDEAEGGRGDASVFLAMWFLFAFVLFSAMLTKFHHYMFPAIPPAAMLTGILLDQWLTTKGVSSALGVANPIKNPPSNPQNISITTDPRATPFHEDTEHHQNTGHYESTLLSAMALGSAVLVGLVGRDLSGKPAGDITGQIRLLHLFTYNYRRPWPEGLDFSNTLIVFTLAAVAFTLLLALPRMRKAAVFLLLSTALGFSAWLINVYLIKASPHWGQRETIEAYYKTRANAQEPLIAYQMNWKGENFYTGNHLPAFVSTGEIFKAYVRKQRAQGVQTFFFTTEHGRIANLRGELGNPSHFDILTDKHLNNKFAMIRVHFDPEPPPPSPPQSEEPQP